MLCRRFVTFPILLLALLCTAGCHRARKGPASVLKMNDPTIEKQLVSGFYDVEANAWRWSAKQFIVTLLPPSGSDEKGAKLELHFVIPGTQLSKLGPMTLSVDIEGESLAPETFSTPGEHVYARDLPPGMLHTNLLPVIFMFDKAAPPSGGDQRELGAVVTSIALKPE